MITTLYIGNNINTTQKCATNLTFNKHIVCDVKQTTFPPLGTKLYIIAPQWSVPFLVNACFAACLVAWMRQYNDI